MHTHSLGPTVQSLKPKNKPLRMLISKTVNSKKNNPRKFHNFTLGFLNEQRTNIHYI